MSGSPSAGPHVVPARAATSGTIRGVDAAPLDAGPLDAAFVDAAFVDAVVTNALLPVATAVVVVVLVVGHLRRRGVVGAVRAQRDAVSVEPDDALDDADLRAARAAADAGDWRPAAALLHGTTDHDLRYARLDVLAQHALRSGGWLDAWAAVAPDDPRLLALRAAVVAHRAWEVRGAGWVPQDWDAFTAVLRDAEALARAAAAAAPADPDPHVVLLRTARGLEVSRDVMDARCAGLRRLAPLHLAGHAHELQYRCAKWHGSADEMFATARRAAAAPPGSALHLLVLQAHLEHAGAHRWAWRGRRHLAARATRQEVAAAVDAWLSGPGGPSPVGRTQAHNLVAYYGWTARDRALARPHLEVTRRHLARLPWATDRGDARRTHAAALRWAGLAASR